MTFEYRDADGGHLSVSPLPGVPYVLVRTDPEGCAVPADLVPDAIAGIRDTARTASGQQPETAVAYGDGKGRVYCQRCAPTVEAASVPLTVNHVDHWELCPSCGRHVVDVARETPAVGQPAEAQATDAAPLTAAERQFLKFALDLAFDAMVSGDGFTDEDDAAMARLRRMAEEARA